MECVCNYLVSKHQSQKQVFNRAHSVRELDDLQPSQELLFLSPAADQYIPGTILKKATVLYSYSIEAQRKRHCRTRKHIRHIHLGIPVKATQHQWLTITHNPNHKPSHIPKPKPQLHPVCQPKKHLPKPTKHPLSRIPIPQLPQPSNTSPQSTHYSPTCPPLTAPAHPLRYLWNSSYHQALDQCLLHPTHWRFLAQQALTPHPQSQHQQATPPASPVTLDNKVPASAHPVALPPLHQQEPKAKAAHNI